MSSRNVLLVIPTYNEAGNIEPLLREIDAEHLGVDILVIDDHSPDGTGQVVERLSTHIPVKVMHRGAKLGLGSAHKDGFTYAIDHGYTHVMTMDADFAHAPSALRAMLSQALSVEVVIGSRYLQGGGLAGWTCIRRMISHTAHWLTTHLLKLPYDCTGGFRAYRVASLKRLEYRTIKSDGYAFLIEMVSRLRDCGCSIQEIPIVVNGRNQGTSKISRYEILHAMTTLLRLSLQRARRDRQPLSPGRSR